MTREIKFRAWYEKKMVMDLGPSQIEEGNPINLLIKGWQDDGVVLMQFTGLKDKNGKPIYEGDILSPGNDVVRWNDAPISNCGCCYDVTAVGFDLSDINLDSCEVIGNIYENPELLKGNA